ncbi:MAG: NUDIX domain-containing protein [Patescibacteria group bacterium]|nr:NUDIX domain-containing protein [Patescibacteria group bacterium]
MKRDFSAGGIVFKNESGKVYLLVSQHSQHHGWVFPKGFIGDKIAGESKEETALREVQEETGIIGKILEPLPKITYWYQMEGEKHKKTVYYFIMEFVGGDTSKHDWEMEQVEWLPIEEVTNRLTFDSDKVIWEQAKKKIEALTS